MKKNIISNLLLWMVAVTGVCSSCSDYLEVEPTNKSAVSTYEDVRRLMGSYLSSYKDDTERLSGVKRFFTDRTEWLVAHLYSDDFDLNRYLNVYTQNNLGTLNRAVNWNAVDEMEEIWTKYFKNIGFYNMVLAELSKHPSNDNSLNEQVSGEARVLRAWHLFRLMQYFTPYQEARLGLPFNTDPDAVADYVSHRPTQNENYSFIIQELEEVLKYEAIPSDTYNLFYDKRIIHGLLAQIYLYKGGSGAGESADYDKAIAHARALLNMGISYASMLTIPTSSMGFESFGVNKEKTYTPLSFMQYDGSMAAYIYGEPFYGEPQYASESLQALYTSDDLRKDLYFDANWGVMKYNADFNYAYVQVEFFTGAEMQLIIAESLARQGKEAEALKALTDFATTRYTTYTRPAGESVLQSVLNERRREFCFDFCMRWLDLTRLQKGFKRSRTLTNGDIRTYEIKDGDYRFCCPIPPKAEGSESDIEQNPGWGDL